MARTVTSVSGGQGCQLDRLRFAVKVLGIAERPWGRRGGERKFLWPFNLNCSVMIRSSKRLLCRIRHISCRVRAGGHVGKIQLALILLDRAAIAADGIYGPATAAAVTAYKKKRQIVNAQNKADNIVGKKTIDRLDKEMLAAEQLNNDRTPRCTFPPKTQQSTRHHSRPQAGGAQLTGFMLLADKDASLPLAKSWVGSTLAKIGQVERKLSSLTVASPADIAFFASIETHFKVNIPDVSKSEASDRLAKISRCT